jgi:hypothetical protein
MLRGMDEQLGAELEAALLRELGSRYLYENTTRFDGALRTPVIALTDTAKTLGRWVPAGRCIEIARAFVLAAPWHDVLAVLLHEMAHQYVDEVLRVGDETAHGETFRRVCADFDIDARAAGAPVVTATLTDVEGDRVLERIRKLLALAGSDNQHEAELAMQKAHALMLRHNLAAIAAERTFYVRQLGGTQQRVDRLESAILGLLAELFFVKVIILPVYSPRLGVRTKAYELSGTRPNVEMAEHVYTFLRATAGRLWQQNRTDKRVRSGRDRLSYQVGVILGFRDKLVAERRVLKTEGLVWVGDADLDKFYRARHPRISTRRQTTRYNGAHSAGREAGRTVVLHKPVTPSSSAGGPRLLR